MCAGELPVSAESVLANMGSKKSYLTKREIVYLKTNLKIIAPKRS
jgi:hypothetical protein